MQKLAQMHIRLSIYKPDNLDLSTQVYSSPFLHLYPPNTSHPHPYRGGRGGGGEQESMCVYEWSQLVSFLVATGDP